MSSEVSFNLRTLGKDLFENMEGKEENAGNHNVFNPFKDKNHHLTLFQTTNFRHFQSERVCRRQF